MSHECPTCGRDDFSSEQGMKVHHKRIHGESLVPETECELCGTTFPIKDYTKPNRFCSPECLQEHNRKYHDCAMCGREISGRNKYCCPECQNEARVDRPRPDDPYALLWLLYVYEGFNVRETYRRQRAVLGYDDRLTENEVHDWLREEGHTRENTAWTLQQLGVDISAPDGDDTHKKYYGTS